MGFSPSTKHKTTTSAFSNAVDAASGAFTESLTVSGVPVATGTGGGGGASTGTIAGIIGNKLGLEHDPVALYLFDQDLTDSSGNGLDLTVKAGSERYTSIHGLVAAKMDDTTRFWHSPTDTALAIVGDITIQVIILAEPQSDLSLIVDHSSSGEASATNINYSVRILANNERISTSSESGSGTNFIFDSIASLTPDITLITVVRESDVITIYLDGIHF